MSVIDQLDEDERRDFASRLTSRFGAMGITFHFEDTNTGPYYQSMQHAIEVALTPRFSDPHLSAIANLADHAVMTGDPDVAFELAEMVRTLICKGEHLWVDATNEVVTSGEVCTACGAVRAASKP